MTARVPYLTALTKRSAAQPALRPPRQLFAEQTPPVRADFTPGALPGALPALSALSALTAIAERPVASGRPAAAGADPGPMQAASPVPAASPARPALASARKAPAVTSSPVPRNHTPPPVASAPPARQQPHQEPADQLRPAAAPSPQVGTAPVAGRPPESWADPRWALPVELPAPELPAPELPATPMRKDFGGAIPLPEPGRPTGQPGSDRQRPVPDLMPARAPGPAGSAGPDAGHRQDRPRGARPAQVSIGTIEVTVVPQALPQPPRPVSRRPVSPLPASPPADRLRDGIRRWHGTAQG